MKLAHLFHRISSFFKKKDELVGIWETSKEGGFQIVMGSQLIFHEDGTGKYTSWGHSYDEPYEYKGYIHWGRIDQNTIWIEDIAEGVRTEIRYKKELYRIQYSNVYEKIYEPTKRLGESYDIYGFWIIPSELFKQKKR